MVTAKPVRSRMILRAMLMNMVVFNVTTDHHCTGNCGGDADEQTGQAIQFVTAPDPQMNVVVMNYLHSDTEKQQSRVLPPGETAEPLPSNQRNIQTHVSERLSI